MARSPRLIFVVDPRGLALLRKVQVVTGLDRPHIDCGTIFLDPSRGRQRFPDHGAPFLGRHCIVSLRQRLCPRSLLPRLPRLSVFLLLTPHTLWIVAALNQPSPSKERRIGAGPPSSLNCPAPPSVRPRPIRSLLSIEVDRSSPTSYTDIDLVSVSLIAPHRQLLPSHWSIARHALSRHAMAHFLSLRGSGALQRRASPARGKISSRTILARMGDFDLEAYLEAPVERKSRGREEEPVAKEEKSGDRPSNDRREDEDRRPRSRSRDRRSRSRDRHDDRDDRRRGSHGRYGGRDDRHGGRDDRYGGRDDRHGGRDDRRGRYGGRDRSPSPGRGRDRSRGRSGDRDAQRDPVEDDRKKMTPEERQLMELERDQRTVFVSQLVKKADEYKLKRYFENIGKVRNVIMIRDRNTNRHKGFAYVEMDVLEDVPKVLMLHDIVPDFQKFPIVVKASEAEKNFVAKKEAEEVKKAGGVLPNPQERRRLYVGNLHVSIADADLMRLFQPFGNLESVQVQRNDMGVSRGYAFVMFSDPKTAEVAVSGMNGVEVLEQPLRINYMGDGPGGTRPLMANSLALPPGKGNWRLDDGGDSGVSMDASSRAALMAKLGDRAGLPPPSMPPQMAGLAAARTPYGPGPAPGPGAAPSMAPGMMPGIAPGMTPGMAPGMASSMGPGGPPASAALAAALGVAMSAAPVAAPGGVAGPMGGMAFGAAPGVMPEAPRPGPPGAHPGPAPTRFLMVANMFNPVQEAAEGGPQWDVDIKEDMEEEVTTKFAKPLFVKVDKADPSGCVFLVFSDPGGAERTAQGLNGRFFSGKQIVTQFLEASAFLQRCPEAAPVA